jgi:hypothetical protein
VRVPALLFAGSSDCVTPPAQHQIPIYNALASPCRTLVTVTGASHCQFAQANTACSLGESCSPSITRSTQHAIVNRFLTPWLDAQLKADPTGWPRFSEALATSDDVTWVQDCAVLAVSPSPASGGFSLRLTVAPNPSAGRVDMRFTLPAAAETRLEVRDVAGRLVRTLRAERLAAGAHREVWDGRDATGHLVAPGRFWLRLSAGDARAAESVTLVR